MNKVHAHDENEEFVNYIVKYTQNPDDAFSWARVNNVRLLVFMDVDGGGLNGYICKFETRESAELFIRHFGIGGDKSFLAEDSAGTIHYLQTEFTKQGLQCSKLCGKTWFLADLMACEEYLQKIKLKPVCDASVRGIIISRILKFSHLPQVASYLDVLSRVPVLSSSNIIKMLEIDPSYVWISCGTSLGLSLYLPPAIGALKSGCIVGVASASAFNAGYAGITLREWGENSLGRIIVRFYGGREVSK